MFLGWLKKFDGEKEESPIDIHLLDSYFKTEYCCEPDFIVNSASKIESEDAIRVGCYPAVFLAAGSGCGKTRFLIEMWNHYYQAGNICLLTTFNGEGLNPSGYTKKFDKDLESCIAERIFYAYVRFLGYKYERSMFQEKNFRFKSLETVVKLIRAQHERGKILIFVDEFLKIPAEQKERSEVLSTLFSLKRKVCNCFVVVTGLYADPSFLEEYSELEEGELRTQSSIRPVQFLSLPKFSGIDLIKKVINLPCSEEYSNFLTEHYHYSVPNLCNLCGNHARSLVLAGDAFNASSDGLAQDTINFFQSCVTKTLQSLKSCYYTCNSDIACKILAITIWNILPDMKTQQTTSFKVKGVIIYLN